MRSCSPFPVPLLICLTIASLGGGIGCQTAAPRYSPLMEATNSTAIPQKELSIRLHDFVNRYAATVEGAADSLIRIYPENRGAYQLGMRAKIEGIPLVLQAAFRPGPMAGALDAWVLCFQLIDLVDVLEVETGLELGVLREAFVYLEGEAARITRMTFTDETAFGRDDVRDWAASHPIRSDTYGRESTAQLLAELTGRGNAGSLAVVGSMAESIDELTARANVYVEQIPSQARWQAELLLTDVFEGIQLDSILGAVADIQKAARTADQELGGLSGTIADERTIVLDALEAERRVVMSQLEGMIGESFDEIDAQREVAMVQVGEIFEEALLSINRQRLETMVEIEELRVRATLDVVEAASNVIDHFFVRLVQLLVVFGVVALAIVWLMLRRYRPRPAT